MKKLIIIILMTGLIVGLGAIIRPNKATCASCESNNTCFGSANCLKPCFCLMKPGKVGGQCVSIAN